MKKWILVEMETLYLDGPVEEVIGRLRELPQKYPNHRNFKLEYNWEELALWGEREETDEEYTHRLEMEKKREARKVAKKEKKEKQERYLLERLKAKYG